jgi:hypothetical protein
MKSSLLWLATLLSASTAAAQSAGNDQWLLDWAGELQAFQGSSTSTPGAVTDWPAFWSQGRAQGKGAVRLTSLPMHLEDIDKFVPYGLMVGGHVCPIDHCYFFPKTLREGQPHFDVLAPAAGLIVILGHRTQLTGSTERARAYDDYALTIEHSGTFYTQYDLLTSLAPAILEQIEEPLRAQLTGKTMLPQTHVRIPVKAGQVIGTVGGRSLDFGVINTETRLPGFLTPSLYGHYSWRTHLVSPFDYLDASLTKRLQSLNARKVPPFGGKIDYDIDGRLIGNWFRAGTGGYPGDRSDPLGYWMGHLAFAYHHIDPSKVVISIGDFGGKPAQFWVKGNTPDPATITEKDGLTKFELVYATLGSNGNTYEGIPTGVQGIALAQVLPNRRLKFEAFPGLTSAKAAQFTDAAHTYER